MAVFENLDWLWPTLGWMLAGTGVLVGVWALFGDRARGRRRCPSCWYDMAGVSGLVCPECGRDAKRKKRLGKVRRRWKWAAVACVFIATGGGLRAWGKVQREGWWALVPTAIIISQLPEAGSEYEFNPSSNRWETTPWVREMQQRVAENRLRNWELRWALERARVIRTRTKWNAEQPVRIGIWPPAWIEGPITVQTLSGETAWRMSGLSISGSFASVHMARERDQAVGTWALGMQRLALDITVSSGYSAFNPWGTGADPYERTLRISLPVQIVSSSEETISPVRAIALDGAVQRTMRFQFHSVPHEYAVLHVDVDRHVASALEGIARGFTAELLDGDQVVESIVFHHSQATPKADRFQGVVQTFRGRSLNELQSGAWRFRILGDGAASLREFEYGRYWAGEFELRPGRISACGQWMPLVPVGTPADVPRRHEEQSTDPR